MAAAAETPAADQPSTRPPTPRWRWAPLVVVAGVAAVALPQLVVVLARGRLAFSDPASIEVLTRDVFSSDPPLRGAWSRYGWSHPGPLAFYLLAGPQRVFGGGLVAMQVGALLLNLTAVVAALTVLARRGLAAFAAGAVAFMAVAWSLPEHGLVEYWNATLVILPFTAALVAAWAVWCGDHRAIVWLVLLASFTAQAHLAFGLVLAPAAVSALAAAMVRARRSSVERRSLGWAALAAVVSIAPVLVDVVTNRGGNPRDLFRWATGGSDEPGLGLAEAARLVGRSTSLTHLVGPDPPSFVSVLALPVSPGLLPGVLLVALTVSGVVAVQSRFTDEVRLVALLGGTWVVAFVATANVSGTPYEWLVRFLPPLAWLSWMAVALVAWRTSSAWLVASVPARLKRVRAMAGTAAVVVGVVFAGAYLSQMRQDFMFTYATDALAVLGPAAEDAARAAPGPVLVLDDGDLSASWMIHGVVNWLDGRGLDVHVDEGLRRHVGDHRVGPGHGEWHLVVAYELLGPSSVRGGSVDGDIEVIAAFDPLTTADRQRLDAVVAEVTVILDVVGRADLVDYLASPLALDLVGLVDAPALAARAGDLAWLGEMRQGETGRYLLLRTNTPG